MRLICTTPWGRRQSLQTGYSIGLPRYCRHLCFMRGSALLDKIRSPAPPIRGRKARPPRFTRRRITSGIEWEQSNRQMSESCLWLQNCGCIAPDSGIPPFTFLASSKSMQAPFCTPRPITYATAFAGTRSQQGHVRTSSFCATNPTLVRPPPS